MRLKYIGVGGNGTLVISCKHHSSVHIHIIYNFISKVNILLEGNLSTDLDN